MSIKKQTQNVEIPSILPVIPTMDVVVFPHMVVPLLVLDEQIIRGIEHSLEDSKKILLLATRQQEGEMQGPIGTDDLYSVGTVAHIMRVMHLPEGGVKVLVQGVARARVEDIISEDGMLTVSVASLPFYGDDIEDGDIEQRVRNLIKLTESMSSSGKIFGPDTQIILSQLKEPEKIADFILSHLNISVGHAQDLLEKQSILELFDGLYEELSKEIEVAKVQDTIQNNARESINQSQREYYLREQLRAIKKELGDDNDSEVEEIRQKLEKLELPEEVRVEAQRQLSRLEKIPPDSMENSVLRNYLDWVVALPWNTYTTDNLDIKHAHTVLDEDHYGLLDVKDRILDYLSVRALKENCRTPILCLVGPPGVGKTSLGQSIARSMGRNFFRISLGGIHDEAEIRGHRRTYVGAMPGRLIQALRKAGSNNPLIMIDEIDKIGRDQRGDPTAALLEVLDPEQNSTFYDNYLGVHYDLSKILFVATANDLGAIPPALRDRMEIINISGYTLDEKVNITKQHLIPKSISNYGLEQEKIAFKDDVIESLVRGYTREAGVRSLERIVQKLCAKYARSLLENKKRLTFSTKNLRSLLGVGHVSHHTNLSDSKIGVANGLAWTPNGGEVLQVESVIVPGRGKIILTGQLGEVMKESAQAAITYARAHAKTFSIPKKMFTEYDIHIHLPAGAIPKDGPSAGITLLSSILSVLTGRAIDNTFAMTGEMNLRGDVLPIGGLKEKILAAKQEGLGHVIVPHLNEADLDYIGDVAKEMDIILVHSVREVLEHVLLPKAKQ